MASPYHVVVIVGSIRKESFTLKIANALAKLAPAALKPDVTTLHRISFFNQDLEAAPPADLSARIPGARDPIERMLRDLRPLRRRAPLRCGWQ